MNMKHPSLEETLLRLNSSTRSQNEASESQRAQLLQEFFKTFFEKLQETSEATDADETETVRLVPLHDVEAAKQESRRRPGEPAWKPGMPVRMFRAERVKRRQ